MASLGRSTSRRPSASQSGAAASIFNPLFNSQQGQHVLGGAGLLHLPAHSGSMMTVGQGPSSPPARAPANVPPPAGNRRGRHQRSHSEPLQLAGLAAAGLLGGAGSPAAPLEPPQVQIRIEVDNPAAASVQVQGLPVILVAGGPTCAQALEALMPPAALVPPVDRSSADMARSSSDSQATQPQHMVSAGSASLTLGGGPPSSPATAATASGGGATAATAVAAARATAATAVALAHATAGAAVAAALAAAAPPSAAAVTVGPAVAAELPAAVTVSPDPRAPTSAAAEAVRAEGLPSGQLNPAAACCGVQLVLVCADQVRPGWSVVQLASGMISA